MIVVSRETYPLLRKAFEMIERDSGGHLIGTVYPHLGPPLNLEVFHVPGYPHYMLAMAEACLSRLSEEEFEAYVIGDQDEAELIAEKHFTEACRRLGYLRTILDDFFNDFEPQDP